MSLLDIAESNRQGGLDGYKQLSSMENQRNSANQQFKSQRKAQQIGAVGTGIGTGLAAATVFTGPVGIGVGLGMAILGGLF